MQVHLSKTDRINHLTNHPAYLKKQENIVSDPSSVKNYIDRFMSDELSSKGLNYATSHYLNGSDIDPIQTIAGENIVAHTYKEGNRNFMIDYFESDQIRSRVENVDEGYYHMDQEARILNHHAKKRVAQKQRLQNELDATEREGLRKQLYNMFFKMKEVVKNLNDENPEDAYIETKEEIEAKRSGINKYLIPKWKKEKEDLGYGELRNQAFRDYFNLRSSELKDVIYEDIFFDENLNKNQGDPVMQKLSERLEEKNYNAYKQIGREKTKDFMRLLMVRELMMKEERDRVIQKRLEMKLLQEEEEEEVQRILGTFKIKDKNSAKKVKPILNIGIGCSEASL